jgi:membrane protein DedA with SNARE-associated domain
VFGDLDAWLATVPPLTVYAVVAVVIGLESMGVPLPGEVTLLSAALLAATGRVDPLWVAVGASAGAILGDSLGYYLGRRGGRPGLDRLSRRFPRHIGPDSIGAAERAFLRWGGWTVFVGRFVALLRILAGPVAGVLGMPYRRFLMANAAGGVVWAAGTTYVIYLFGQVAEHWLKASAKWALAAAVVVGVAIIMIIRIKAKRATASVRATQPAAIRETR